MTAAPDPLRTALPPGPYRLEWPPEQGGWFKVWGKQGTPPDFADGWAIPLVALGAQGPMEWLMAHLSGLDAAREYLDASEEQADRQEPDMEVVIRRARAKTALRAALATPGGTHE